MDRTRSRIRAAVFLGNPSTDMDERFDLRIRFLRASVSKCTHKRPPVSTQGLDEVLCDTLRKGWVSVCSTSHIFRRDDDRTLDRFEVGRRR